jgi:acyl dehydratase
MRDWVHYEDYVVGERRLLGSRSVSEEDLLRFSHEFDPQPFHIDKAAAEKSIYGGLIASGWHICAVAMRVICDSFLAKSAALGSPGVEQIRYISPMRPGDTLTVHYTVLEARPSASKPDRGVLLTEIDIENQDGRKVATIRGYSMVARRPQAATAN